MSVSVPSAGSRPDSRAGARGLVTRLWRRDLDHYPETKRRYAYLTIVVATTVVLYYQLYIQFGVATSIIAHFQMSFTYFTWVVIAGAVVGAFASIFAGLADQWGRGNLVVFGSLFNGLLLVAGLPLAPGKTWYLVLFAVLSFVEGVVLVATPALIRDFSPQLGRATAMGTWAMGPVLGSLVVTGVTTLTLGHTTWQDQLRYAGIAGLAVSVVTLFGLRELSSRLRDQIMVSIRDRALIEARARNIVAEPDTAGHWRQMLRPDVLGSAFAISLYLLFYLSAVGQLVVYFATAFGYSEQRPSWRPGPFARSARPI